MPLSLADAFLTENNNNDKITFEIFYVYFEFHCIRKNL